MAGHNKWSKIKRKKAVADQKKGKVFSKLAKAIELAAQKGTDPDTNLDLRKIIDKAKSENMPATSIERALAKGGDKSSGTGLEEIWYEGFGPGGVGILIKSLTDNRNRTVAELKHLFSKSGYQLASQGSVQWMFERIITDEGVDMIPKSSINLGEEDSKKLGELEEELGDHDDVQEVFTNES